MKWLSYIEIHWFPLSSKTIHQDITYRPCPWQSPPDYCSHSFNSPSHSAQFLTGWPHTWQSNNFSVHCVVRQPLELQCRVIVSTECMVCLFMASNCIGVKCPCCTTDTPLTLSELKPAPPLINTLVMDWLIQCPTVGRRYKVSHMTDVKKNHLQCLTWWSEKNHNSYWRKSWVHQIIICVLFKLVAPQNVAAIAPSKY